MFTIGHHAQLNVGEWAEIRPRLVDFLEKKLNISTLGNPDYLELIYDTFGINDGRELKTLASRRAFGERRVFVLVFTSITHEAQNSLLKLFEEPSANTNFFIVSPSLTFFLPTLLSRMCINSRRAREARSTDVVNFLKASPGKRLAIVSEIVEQKDKSTARDFLGGIEKAIRINCASERAKLAKYADVLHEIVKMKRYLEARGSSVKQVLEHISLVVPKL